MCVEHVFACIGCDFLCDGVWLVSCVFVVVFECLLFNVFVWFVCGLLCDVVCFVVVFCVSVCVVCDFL